MAPVRIAEVTAANGVKGRNMERRKDGLETFPWFQGILIVGAPQLYDIPANFLSQQILPMQITLIMFSISEYFHKIFRRRTRVPGAKSEQVPTMRWHSAHHLAPTFHLAPFTLT